MTTTGAEHIFIDTNILVYASIAEAPLHQPAFSRLQAYEQTGQPRHHRSKFARRSDVSGGTGQR